MGRKVVAEQAIEKKFEADIKARLAAVQRGLIIGHVTCATPCTATVRVLD